MVKKNQIFHFYRNFGQRLTTYWFLWFWQRSKFFLHQITYPKFFIHFFQQLCLLKTKIYTVKYIKKFLLQFSNRSSVKFQYFIESYCIYVPQSNFISCSLPAGLHFQHFSTSVFLHRKEQGLQHYKPASTDDQIPAGPPSLPHFP